MMVIKMLFTSKARHSLLCQVRKKEIQGINPDAYPVNRGLDFAETIFIIEASCSGISTSTLSGWRWQWSDHKPPWFLYALRGQFNSRMAITTSTFFEDTLRISIFLMLCCQLQNLDLSFWKEVYHSILDEKPDRSRLFHHVSFCQQKPF